ncbi:hypothetical protein [uncultured Methanolobus sp.]|uniref:hypothetical protein n=1 Tax=uncultured Methanolobus sp. TaxID=218300 RepID=UPI0029C7A68D|nr:hypothetical protein [uncultured Methanolobus sp.]
MSPEMQPHDDMTFISLSRQHIWSMLLVFGPIFLELALSDRSIEAENLIQDIRSVLPGKSQSF